VGKTKKRVKMTKKQVTLTFTPEVITEPIIYNLGQQFRLITNILQANLTEDRGWILLEINGAEKDIEAGITWAISKGVRVDPADGDSTNT
jgi:ABC-type methionine transport system ATPase subunit